MAAKKSARGARITDFKSLKWCLNNLDDQMLDEADKMPFDLAKFGEFLDVLNEQEGMEFKFGWDAYSGCSQMTLIGAWKGFRNTGHAISARSDAGFEDCARLLSFKYDIIAQRDLPSVFEETTKRRKRG